MTTRPTLTMIGCGKVGQTLGRLWHAHGLVTMQDVLNTSADSAHRAIEFIGAGTAALDLSALRAADIVLIGAPDDRIAGCSAALVRSHCAKAGSVVFHCSGALPSSILQAVRERGAATASVHPIRSFASPIEVVRTFSGTYCGVEGDPSALAVLRPLFAAIGAHFVEIEADRKVLYHAAAVFASNYLVTLLDTAVQTFGQAGIPQEAALKMMASLVRETTENVLKTGPQQALTGPIARGDIATVIGQYRALKNRDQRLGSLYKQLGKLTARLARRRDRSEEQ
jgi:predicted short-subunit dehydrogenase-like oxidoreductase (DUF2520 family)